MAAHGHGRLRPAAGIIEVEARAFTPEDAQAIAAAVLAESGRLVNALSEQAREDAVRFARDELAEAEAHLAEMRAALGGFRRAHNLVDPAADVAGQSGLLAALNAGARRGAGRRATCWRATPPDGDQRVVQADRRIAAITARIEEERGSLDVTGVAGTLPEVVGRYEELTVDLEFANAAYTQALAGLAAARAEARRQSRYLAAHVSPTLATTALYPRRCAARRPRRPVPAARLGHPDARLLQRPRQPLSHALPPVRPRPARRAALDKLFLGF